MASGFFTGGSASDLAKLPFLFEHYISEHQETETFLEYLKNHYTNSEHRDSDAKHHELPNLGKSSVLIGFSSLPSITLLQVRALPKLNSKIVFQPINNRLLKAAKQPFLKPPMFA